MSSLKQFVALIPFKTDMAPINHSSEIQGCSMQILYYKYIFQLYFYYLRLDIA